ncbi:hypothetical protein ACODT5_12865 [Streptomyces sp. 5.8]|uniref:hypothetical protein n=1 Tax=Streptomyces sp. 5.8 TaxID=3406571 RepID=UPI003BB72F9D
MDDAPLPRDPSLPDVCDFCHQAIEPGTSIYGRVRNSSFAHPVEPEQDGYRLLTACTPEHLGDLQQQYHNRPFNEELWVVEIDRAMSGRTGKPVAGPGPWRFPAVETICCRRQHTALPRHPPSAKTRAVGVRCAAAPSSGRSGRARQ